MSNTPETPLDVPKSKILDFGKFLPFGETLRGYLEQPFVRTSDLSDLLRSRGVFVQDAEKEDLIPILVATLVSPFEFQTLLDCRKERDLKEKVINRTRNWTSKRSLVEAANSSVDLARIPFTSTDKCKLLGKPTITPVAGNSEHIEVGFVIQRTRQSLDWSNEESQFAGKVTLKKEEIDGKVVVSIMHTSPETKNVAEKIATLIEDSLRSSEDIGDATSEDRILYSSFNNIARADFLLSLTGRFPDDALVFQKLTHFDALTEHSEEVPEDCKDLIEGFEQLRMKGELHRSAYCRRREIYPFVRFYRMDARYKFKILRAEGECVIRYEFSDYGSTQDQSAEFTHEVEISSRADNSRHLTKASIKTPIQELVARVIAEKYKYQQCAKATLQPPKIQPASELTRENGGS